MANRYCPQCGKENLNNSNFCPECGADLRGAPAQDAFNYAPQPQQVNYQQDGYEEVVRLRRRSPATQIVALVLTVVLEIPCAIFLTIYGYGLGIAQDQWFTFAMGLIVLTLATTVEPFAIIFGFIRLIRLNNCANRPILYSPTRNTFVFYRGNNPLEVYAKNIVYIVSFGGYLRMTYYDEYGQHNTYIGWSSPDVLPVLQAKVEYAKTLII